MKLIELLNCINDNCGVVIDSERYNSARAAVINIGCYSLAREVRSLSIINNGRDLDIRVTSGRRYT